MLINNVGLMAGQRRVTADGFDEVFAVNHLAPFLLTNLLLGKLTAAGDEHFSVGMDLKQLMSGAQARGGFEAVLDQRLRVLAAIEDMDKPWIATLFGNCLGGGLELPLACHFRLAANEGARIGLPELDLGTVPAWGGTARLTRTVGRAHALYMILRAKKIDGPTALAIGLVQEPA